MIIALDLVNNDIYWNEAGNAHIGRDQISNDLTYSIFDDADATGVIESITVPENGDEVYWMNTSNGIIRRKKDRSPRETVYPGGDVTGSVGVTVDLYSNSVYWATYAAVGGTLYKGTTEGGTPQPIVQNVVEGPEQLDIDLYP